MRHNLLTSLFSFHFLLATSSTFLLSISYYPDHELTPPPLASPHLTASSLLTTSWSICACESVTAFLTCSCARSITWFGSLNLEKGTFYSRLPKYFSAVLKYGRWHEAGADAGAGDMRPVPFPTSHDHVFFSRCALASLNDVFFIRPFEWARERKMVECLVSLMVKQVRL